MPELLTKQIKKPRSPLPKPTQPGYVCIIFNEDICQQKCSGVLFMGLKAKPIFITTATSWKTTRDDVLTFVAVFVVVVVHIIDTSNAN